MLASFCNPVPFQIFLIDERMQIFKLCNAGALERCIFGLKQKRKEMVKGDFCETLLTSIRVCFCNILLVILHHYHDGKLCWYLDIVKK